MEKLTIEDISRILSGKNGLSKEAAENFAKEMFSVVQDGVERDKLVKVKGFGAFKVVDVEARESINVNTGERVLIEGHGKISFTPDSTMKELVNKPFSQFETVVLNDGVSFDDIPAPSAEEDDESEEVEQRQPAKEEIKKEPAKETKEELVKEILNEEPIKDEVVEEAPKEERSEVPVVEETAAPPHVEKTTEVPLSPMEETIEEDEPEEEEEEHSDTAKWIVAGVIALVLLALAACGGYIYGLNKGRAEAKDYIEAKQEAKPSAPQSKDSILAALHPEEPVVLDSAKAQKVDTAKAQKPKVEPKAEKQNETPKAEKQEAKPKAEPAVSSKYEKMDARVRTGAYRIVGVDRTVTVKKGETLKRISKAYLGEGMECYVEVLNNLSGNDELKEGMKLKIPKLELKKRNK